MMPAVIFVPLFAIGCAISFFLGAWFMFKYSPCQCDEEDLYEDAYEGTL